MLDYRGKALVPVEEAQICIIVNPDGRELANLRKDQIVIAVVSPVDSYGETSLFHKTLLFLGYSCNELVLFDFGKGISFVPGLHKLLRAINNAIDDLNWRLDVFGSEVKKDFSWQT